MIDDLEIRLQNGERLYGSMVDETLYRKQAGERLCAARLALGYKARGEFANATGVSESALSNWEQGSEWVSPWYVGRLRRIFGIDHNWLYDGSLVGLPDDLFAAIHGLDRES